MAKTANANDVILNFSEAFDWFDKNTNVLRARNMKSLLSNRYKNIDWAKFHASSRDGYSVRVGDKVIYTFIGSYTGETTENIEKGTPIVFRWKAGPTGGTNQYKVGNSKWMYFGETWTKYGQEIMN